MDWCSRRLPSHHEIELDEGNGVDDVIVISGILLLIAVVFLVIGLFGPLAWVYASIVVSVLSFVFLLVGVRQRRDVATPAAAPAPTTPRGLPAADEPSSADVTVVPAGGRRPAAAAAATAAVLEERQADVPARVVERARPVAAPVRPTTPAASRLRGSTATRPRAVLPARLAEAPSPAKKAAAKKAAPAKAAAKKAAPAKAAAKKAAPAKAAAKKAAPAKAAAKKAAPAKAAAKKTVAKKTVAKKTAR